MLPKEKEARRRKKTVLQGQTEMGKEIAKFGDDQIAQALGVRILQKTLSLGMTR